MKNRVRELRAARDWSQSELADQLKVSRQTINAIETEKYDPSLPLALKMARLFRQPVETIFEDGEKVVAEVHAQRDFPTSAVPGPQELVL
ncbi:MAG: helix-turn-helix transcriptional regulator [Verrucomicrobia bacterium]|nr:helix-turn-helix transcriptional regulator [Verrucomicrobiota bacterium]